MFRKTTSIVAAAPLLAWALLFSGCNSQPSHPNQINAFDGACYNSLTAARAALEYLRSSIASTYPKYTALFNEAAASYTAAVSIYTLYRTNPSDQAAVSANIANLTVSIVALENAFQADMQVPPQTAQQVRNQAEKIRASARANVTLSDILTELEIAAAVARTVPAAAPYAQLASVVISATAQAVAAETAIAGQPIDLTTLAAIPPIPLSS
ncbi:MAG TPA: hypothetical protein VKX41_22045 [Alloacidobacterium sp.]|nr:hypothetical protein [Alloacidobacterium sp.]